MRETKFTAIILKKQPFNESDEIITAFTKEKGKVRFLAKSVKLQKSKLQGSLQSLFLAEITAVKSKGHLFKLIGSRVLNHFISLREDISRLKYAYYASELILKFTADEHKNERLFNLMLSYLKFLDNYHTTAILEFGLAKFKTAFLESVGYKIVYDKGCFFAKSIGFSNQKGGFVANSNYRGKNLKSSFDAYLKLEKLNFNQISHLFIRGIGDLQKILSLFIEYHLEREIKSEKFLNVV